ncbi:MAG TPA: alpha/beta fold hydrolase [Variovorax sp.]
MNNYREEPVLFGTDGTLLGVLTRPAEETAVGSVACLMFNFGVMHRVGPRRIQVKLARRLAQQGIATLRFDLAGLGDSRVSDATRSFDDQAISDVRAAIDQLQTRLGIREVVIFGLCSGAAHGHQVALQDSRVTGLLTFDGYSFTSRGAKIRRRFRRFMRFPLAQTQRWAQVLLGLNRPSGDLLTGERAKVMTAEDFRRDMDTLVGRGVAIYLIYSATFQDYDRNRDQLHALRGSAFLDKVRYEFMPTVDHSFTEVAGQANFMEAACSWVGEIQARMLERPTAPAPSAEKATAQKAGPAWSAALPA